MLIIIHGDNLIKSRDKLFQLKQAVKNQGQQLTTLSAKKLTAPILEEALFAKDLFGQQHCLIIEELHSLPHGKKRTAFIKQIQEAAPFLEVILWEKKPLTPSNLKQMAEAKIFEYPMGKALWSLLDQLNPQLETKKKQLLLLSEAIEQDSAEFCLLMLGKRISELIATKVGGELLTHPFVKNKLLQQQTLFSLEQLLNAHHLLYHLDQKVKHSQNLLTLSSELDLLLISL